MDENLWQIDWKKLSNERLLDLWISEKLDADEKDRIQAILVERAVIRECGKPKGFKLTPKEAGEVLRATQAEKTSNLSFSEALEAMKAGKKVREAGWDYPKDYIVIEGGRIRRQGTQFAVRDFDAECILANDWQIVE